MTTADKLESLLPAGGPETKDERVIAEAVRELREGDALWQDHVDATELLLELDVASGRADMWRSAALTFIPFAFLSGLAIAALVAGVW